MILRELKMPGKSWYGSHGINWRKLIILVCLLTAAGAVFQTRMIPYYLTIWFLIPPISMPPSKRSLNGTDQVAETMLPQAVPNSFAPEPNFDVGFLNYTPSYFPVPNIEDSAELVGRNFVPELNWDVINHTKISRVEMNALKQPNLSIHGATSNSVSSPKIVFPSTPEQALQSVKEELTRVPIAVDDPELYAPIFRNVSLFKKSYELMEKILKVYIYRDGARPIFHTPNLKGIYASEGWFMKLMEENKQFVVKDPSKAHLFYLPYSAHQLRLSLYVPGSHNMRPLSLFLKNYVNGIAAKYPFWNRTNGSDHFLVACHDWGPYTLTEHNNLCQNTIKVLCNADVSEGIFKSGKDVSLPETSIRTPKRPLRDIQGKPVSQRSILAFFAGNMHGRVRPKLLKHWGDKDPDMKIYGPLPKRVSRRMSYVQHMKTSKFCICPMGYEVNSPRIVEAIYYECVPVIIADNFIPPLDDVLDWSKFAVIVAEKDIPNLKEILVAISLRKYLAMQMGVKRVQKHFLWHYHPIKYDLFHMILHSVWISRLKQI